MQTIIKRLSLGRANKISWMHYIKFRLEKSVYHPLMYDCESVLHSSYLTVNRKWVMDHILAMLQTLLQTEDGPISQTSCIPLPHPFTVAALEQLFKMLWAAISQLPKTLSAMSKSRCCLHFILAVQLMMSHYISEHFLIGWWLNRCPLHFIGINVIVRNMTTQHNMF